ncbi:MAG: bifunctional demethylmenaquinone methyltransferase/2-methoxy-6-polyprenyl-1,4-benzoquinol methylase UbiE [Verrucomicrobiae bacterium]|nr:bifunctional demethylmenaquinone methyltransferase/2-methoxy-6-polyprenyl-1,4-benzoquinol methylase UbiE [Verrucomicrobiae bacterium]
MSDPSYFQPGAERGARVNELFDRIAPRYDLINDIQSAGLHRVWKKWLWMLAQPKPGEKILDLCTGTGDIAFLFADHGHDVTGLDFSAEMLRVANQRKTSTQRIEFLRGDAMNTPFPDQSFDVITIGYGLRNLADYGKALLEMKRLLRPGGRLLILDFGKPDNFFLRAAYYVYLHLAVPIFGQIFCGNRAAYAYILESLKHYPAQRGVDDLLDAVGLENRRVVNFFGGTMSINYAEKNTDPPT